MAAKKTTYVATAPDGTEMTRTSARTYTHAVLAYGTSWNNPEPHWGYISFNGSEELSQKEAAKWEKHNLQVIARGDTPSSSKFLVVPVAAR